MIMQRGLRQTARLAILLAGLSLAASAAAAESAYTDVDTDHCKTLPLADPDDGPSDLVFIRCKGYKDYPLYYKESDLRQSVYFGHLDQEIIDYASETFGPANHIGRKVEWRLDGSGKPYAAILRYFVRNINPETGDYDDKFEGQVLVVSRVGRPEDKRGCVVGYVDALKNPDPNVIARKIADELAVKFVCGKDRPDFHGAKTDPGNDPSYSFPGSQ